MKKNNIFRRLVSLTVAIAMVMTIGTAVFAQNAGRLTLGQSYTQSNRNRNSRYYYTYTPSITGPYVLNARVANSNYKADIEVYTSVSGGSGNESFSGLIASFTVDTTSQQGADYDLNLTAGTTYYFRVRSNNLNYTTTVTLKLNANYETTTIIFNKNSTQASGSMSSVTVVRNQETTLPTCTFTRSGYTFAGWSTTPNGSAQYQDGGSITPASSQAQITLYAKWSQGTTIQFNANNGSGTMNSITVPRGQASTLPECTFTRNGYRFDGWATSRNGDVVYQDGGSITPTSSQTQITLYAKWTAVTAISFSANGGSGTMTGITVPRGQASTLPACTFTRSGYTFAGWSTMPSGQVQYEDEGSITPSANQTTMTLYAKWTQTSTVTFNANGGSGTMSSITIPRGQSSTLPACTFTRSGFRFDGWATSPNGQVVYQDEGSITPNQSTIALYAKWTRVYTATFDANSSEASGTIDPITRTSPGNITLPTTGFTRTGYGLMGWTRSGSTTTYNPGQTYYLSNSYTFYAVWGPQLTLNANGGQGDDVVRAYSAGAQATLSNPGFTRTGYTLLGWSTSSTATSVEYALGSRLAINAPTTLYAVWGATVAFAPNGATGTIDSVTVPLGSSITLPASGFTREGCTLAGWSTASAGTSVDYATNESYTVNGNATLTAVWGCTLSFDANGGEGSMDSIEAIAGATVNLPASTFTRTGYSTIGWSDSSSGETAVTTYTPTQSTVLYVVWTARTVYTVSFNGNGADSGSMDSLQLTDDVTGTIPANGFTRDGYAFVGWSTDASASSASYNEGDPISVTDSDIELYAVWSALPTYSVTFDANGGEGTMSPLVIIEGGSGTIPSCSYTMDGYVCIGWAYDDEATDPDYVKGDSISITSDITLYAIWEEGEPEPEDDEPHLTPEQIRQMNITQFVERLYLVALDRNYDLVGRDYWVDQLMNNNRSGSDIVLGFLGSQEFIGKELSDEEYVTYLYRIFFDREPDAAGLENWTKALANGASREDIVAGFAGSQEWLTFCALYQVNP